MHRFLVALVFTPVLCLADPVDHVAAIQSLKPGDAETGAKLYALHCASCHGKEGKLALNPLARRFAIDPLKFGNDPYALWKTISYGNGLMFRWDGVLSVEQRYQIVHHLREDILKVSNQSQYSEPTEAYFSSLNAKATKDAEAQAAGAQQVNVAPGMIDGSGGTRMQYGPFLQHAVAYGAIEDKNAPFLEDTTEKALVISSGDHVICYDADRLSVSGLWSGKLADTNDTHHTSYKGSRPLMPSGALHYRNVDALGWEGGTPVFEDLYLHGEQVVLRYKIGSRVILETPQAVKGSATVGRHFQIEPGADTLRCLVTRGKEPALASSVTASHSGFTLETRGDSVWLTVPPSKETQTCSLWMSIEGEPEVSRVPEIESLVQGGPRRWPQTVQTAVAPGENVEGYALDELTVPLANPYGSWMRLTALDFFEDGRLAVSTLSGDVWIVSWTPENPTALTWSRFAAGLYEPLGLRIVKEQIYVRGRDRITRLHDLNGDGEADRYESFYEDRNEIGAGYHAFKYDLQTDDNGYFYYSQSGYKSPLSGAVVRVSADGTHAQHVCSDLRNPNGMGAGGPQGWITIADNPSGVAIYNGFSRVEEGGRYGFEHERNTPMLVVLPARVDSSSGGQCWSDPERWGPLSGSIIHSSYSRSSVFYCRTQDVGSYPNGFAMRLPFELKAGVMRPRVNPVDGQVYLATKKGWDSVARVDGMIYRLRETGQPSHFIQDVKATRKGLELTFACELDATSLDPTKCSILREPDKPTKGVETKPSPVGELLLLNAHTLEVGIPGIEMETLEHRTSTTAKGETVVKVNPAISLTVELTAGDGTPIRRTVHATINSLE